MRLWSGGTAGSSAWRRPCRVRLLVFAAAAVLTPASGIGLAGGSAREVDGPPDERPNIVVVTTDDQSMHSFTPEVMPKTFRLMQDGTSFSNGLAAPPLCCPDRAGFLTGQYPHNHLVHGNRPGYADLKDPENTLPVWLDEAGYRTGFVGKYLNGTTEVLGARAAPGWDFWYAIHGSPSYFGATVSNQGVKKTLPERKYLTTQLNRQALRFAGRADDRPFFLWLAEYAPHVRGRASAESPGYCASGVPEPLPGDIRDFRHAELPKRPSFNERDVSDKPVFIKRLDRLTKLEKRQLERNYRCTLAALQEVDRGVGEIAALLRDAGELDNTIFVFTSDNGAFFGEHRITKGKTVAYEEALRVPLAMRAGESALDGPVTDTVAEPAAQIDFAPTFLELAHAQPCRTVGDCRRMDGRSLSRILGGTDPDWPEDRGILAEARGMAELPRDARTLRALGGACGFAAVRTRDELFSVRGGDRVEGQCQDGPEEYYDLSADPFELENSVARAVYSQSVDELRARLSDLRRCSGILGRDEPAPGRPYCE